MSIAEADISIAGRSAARSVARRPSAAPSVARRLPIHAECDVGALVYGPDDDPDALMRAFVDRRIDEGRDVVGILQTRRPAPDGSRRGAALRLVHDAPADEEIAVPQPHARAVDVVADLGQRLEAVIARRPELLVLNRFGRGEIAGAGLWRLMERAVAMELPMVTAVPETHFGDWLAAASGLAVRIRPTASGLERWWHSLEPSAAPRPRESACSAWK